MPQHLVTPPLDADADGILVNAVCRGWSPPTWAAPAAAPVSAGTGSVRWAVDLPRTGPTGGFFRDDRPLPW